ncbi:hypothetical protein M408DRAFT_80958 [Serendipita vermifera MAFF 305830]|uniref:Squalene synthase n=1 Tax=Serendipita vermifera MAFF 305830 TaxID=933852 RepID=A0A0C3A955_SERVB|nr:hypothetical protein M408DRAFT_80958 [Serendipita vermifera MAFF 305830]
MGKFQLLQLLFTHPSEFAAMAQYWLYHSDQKRDITNPKEFKTTGYDRETMKKCWHFLDMTSRSFAMVIKELDGDLARVIALFYLVLRGLDTVEDDMTLSDEIKQPILRTFHQKLTVEGWTFDGCGPNEKDRQLLVEFDNVVAEMGLLEKEARDVIIDITHKMETGMADFAHRAAISKSAPYLTTIVEFDLYCHYVAGLVGEGLSRLFAATGKEGPWIAEQLVLSNSMGLLLQKTNILRDYREDCDEQRYFWPQEIWGRYGFKRPEDMYVLDSQGKTDDRAMWALSEMTLNALSHCIDALDYLVLLKNQTVFNFCAIPAVMAIATLELCFMNPAVFQRNIKIRRGETVGLIMRSTDPRSAAYIFRDYARKIHKKAVPADPNYLGICAMWGKIEVWCEQHFPSFVSFNEDKKVQYAPSDPRSRTVNRYLEMRRKELNQPPTRGDQPVPWQMYAFVLGMTAFLFLVAGVFTLSGLYYFYGEEWTWKDLGRPGFGKIQDQTVLQ